jgi:glycosyltransferase involved in cell wall biosynthesis
MRGGEKCLEVFCELVPTADLFTLVHVPGSVSPIIERHRIITSLLQRLPGGARHYRWYLPLMPAAIEAFDLSAYDVVLSSSHCVAKGVIPRPDALHIAYVHTPMRYAWDMWPHYFPPTGMLSRYAVPLLLNYLRTWDTVSAQRVDHFWANSRFVARRIAKYYRRQATVVYPPVDTALFTPGSERGDYYLMVTALVPYKGIDVAIRAFNALLLAAGHWRPNSALWPAPTSSCSAGARMRNCAATTRRVGRSSFRPRRILVLSPLRPMRLGAR